jgi:hypothetical protein
MRLHWSIVSLDPVFNALNTRYRETDSYSAFHVASTRILEIARASVDDHARSLFHTDALRATTALLQILLRKVTPDRSQLDKYIFACRDGIAISKSLVPDVLTRAEGIFEKLLNKYTQSKMLANYKNTDT